MLLTDVVLIGLLRWLKHFTSAGCRLVPYSYTQYRLLLKKVVNDRLRLDLSITPHSPRAGFAPDSIASGKSSRDTMEEGRWLAEGSLRCYIDIISTAAISVNLRVSGMSSACEYARINFPQFVPGCDAFLWSHAAVRKCEGSGHSAFLAKVGHEPRATSRRVPLADEDEGAEESPSEYSEPADAAPPGRLVTFSDEVEGASATAPTGQRDRHDASRGRGRNGPGRRGRGTARGRARI